MLLGLSVLLLAACGVFVAAEFALVTVDRATVERAAAQGDRKAAALADALRMLSTQLSGAQLGITITNLAIGFMAEPAVAKLIEGPLRAAGLPHAAVPPTAVVIGLVLATAVTMIFGELVPKNLAIAQPLATARAVLGVQRGFTRVTAPALRLLNGAANAVLRRFGIAPQEELASARSPEELVSLVRRSSEKGTLPAETAALLQRSLTFGRKRAEDVCTPRTRMRIVDTDQSVDQVIALARSTGHSRFPVQRQTIDDIVGVVHIKHAVAVPAGQRAVVRVEAVMVPPVRVPNTMALDDLLETLRREGLQIAVVVDEFGGTDGIVTVEDLIEELVGEVLDEHDRVDVHARRWPDGSWRLSGLLRPDELGEITGLLLPPGDYDTLGGLFAERLGRLPEQHDSVSLPGWQLTVDRMDGRRVDRIRLEARDSDARPGDESP